jgi:NADH-ubiquinone oxidoreductase chain 2
MVLFSVLTMIVAIALFSLRISAINFNRITIIVLFYSGFLAYNTIYADLVGSGIGVFSGLFQITTITQSIDVFICLMGALVLLLGENSTIGTGASLKDGVSVKQSSAIGKYLPLLAEYPLIVLFSVLGMSSLISSSDLVSMFLSIELQSFAVYILATIYRDSESATAAGLKYFLLGSLSSALILLGSSLIYGFTGLTSFEGLYMLCSTTTSNHAIEISVLLIVVGLLFKISAAPFHNWAPDVYDGVPTMVTSWLVTMPKISLLVFILEFQGFTQLTNWSSWTYLLLISSLLSLMIGTIGGLSQYRIKRLLAYSTISHVGFLLLALAINSEESVESFLFYLIQYSLTNVNVFFILLAFGYLLHSRGLAPYSPVQFINQLKGQFQVNPLLGISLAICLFSMAGIPPLVGFFGKQMILYAATHNGNFFLALVAILTSVVSAAYYLRVIKVIHFDPYTVTDTNVVNKETVTTSSSLVIATLTLLLIFFILNPTPLLNSAHLLTLSLFYW